MRAQGGSRPVVLRGRLAGEAGGERHHNESKASHMQSSSDVPASSMRDGLMLTWSMLRPVPAATCTRSSRLSQTDLRANRAQ